MLLPTFQGFFKPPSPLPPRHRQPPSPLRLRAGLEGRQSGLEVWHLVNQVSASTAKSMADSSRAKTTALTKPVAGLPLTSKMTNQPALGPYCLPLPTLQEGPAGNHAVRVA